MDEKIQIEDSTPTILDQAKAAGWVAKYYDFGKADNLHYHWFNPSLVERPDGIWMLVRGAEPHPHGFAFGQNSIWAFQMDESGTTPKMGKRLHWLVNEPSQHFEDPRGFYHPRTNQVIVGACTFCWYSFQPWTGAHQCLGMFDADWQCVRMAYPKIGGNPGQMQKIEKHENYEKNWLWWLADEKLHLLYKAKPWQVYRFGESWAEVERFPDESGASWAFGDIRGGTPPVQVGDYYFTFFHSSLPWKDRYRRYYAGCLAFEARPPFRPKLITKEPVLIGSQNDPWVEKKPLVVFPCGALYRNPRLVTLGDDGDWLVSMGVNDIKAAWLKLSHQSLLRRMTSVEDATPIFMESGLSEKEQRLQKLRDNLVKARQAKANKNLAKVEVTR